MPPVTFPNPFLRTSPPPHIVVVIPARYGSTRFPGKPLADIAGRPMIEHVYRRAAEAPGVDAVVVATDDARIAAAVDAFGGVARMTDAAHRAGTDRVAEIARLLPCAILVNVQGDEPLIEPAMIAEVVAPLITEAAVQMTTLRRAIRPEELDSPHVVKVVVDRAGDALYFSRVGIPYVRRGGPAEAGRDEVTHAAREGPAAAGHDAPATPYKHIGIYGYRRDFLLTLAALPPTPLEMAESLEQLRVLEHGFRIRAVETRYDSIGVDTPEDLERVRRHVRPPAQAFAVAASDSSAGAGMRPHEPTT